jgi:hypothetical protein
MAHDIISGNAQLLTALTAMHGPCLLVDGDAWPTAAFAAIHVLGNH